MELFHCWLNFLACLILALLYVGSLYVWNVAGNRDHPSTIKKRCVSVAIMTIISPFYVNYFISEELKQEAPLLTLLGFRSEGLLSAIVFPLLLTFCLFLGPLVQSYYYHPLSDRLPLYTDLGYWHNIVSNPIWWRNQIVAPFSEEFIFRTCMMPLLLSCTSPASSTFIAPLFFGIAHLHHAVDRLRSGVQLSMVCLVSTFQFCYTSLFGVFSAFLFVRTGHFVPLFAVHAFCNHMGLPDLPGIWSEPWRKSVFLFSVYVLGLFLWCLLLYPLTDPVLFHNKIYSYT